MLIVAQTLVSSSRKWAMNQLSVKQEPLCILVNDGRHVFISFLDKDTENEQLKWTWLKYKDFKTMTNLFPLCASSSTLLRFRTFGHSGRVCSVVLKQSVDVLLKNQEPVSRFDWQMRIVLFPNKPILIHARGDSIFASRVLSQGVSLDPK